ncbi:S-adenosylmethionine:tRNA ribosyltransferase-isomerase [Allorhizocola rhizosphaerae]|uniref:S-adenosylmethionine:tRNA ribosyltransferase-isomerase n=1 Tax=Allorhizocola rhizosphaerae TaxID=1872709 RepID=UPI000E3C8D9B|nr:S-adenosylmethionine:tRNA ribosyltransferase-isomerase [Allorhizocola rhizosphaerae]
MNFTLPPELEAHEPPEARGLRRDEVRMLVAHPPQSMAHQRFTDLPDLLEPGDVLVVNNSGTLPAAVDVIGHELALHVSTELDDGRWLVEPRPATDLRALELKGGARVTLESRYTDRLWIASFDGAGSVPQYLRDHGRPIRYSYVEREWPIESYQTVFATVDGSAEMPSAGRPFTHELVTRLVSRGIVIVPITLHTGVASPEAHEKPYPERFSVPAATAHLVNHAAGRVIAVGTTVVRALESATAPDGTVVPREGWTDLIVTPERGVSTVDGLLTGFHEPRASHLLMLEAIAGPALLEACYREAIAGRYLFHEFGDLNLLLRRAR